MSFIPYQIICRHCRADSQAYELFLISRKQKLKKKNPAQQNKWLINISQLLTNLEGFFLKSTVFYNINEVFDWMKVAYLRKR